MNPLKFRVYWELLHICFTVVQVVYMIPINIYFGIEISPIDLLIAFGGTYIMVTHNQMYHEFKDKWFTKR